MTHPKESATNIPDMRVERTNLNWKPGVRGQYAIYTVKTNEVVIDGFDMCGSALKYLAFIRDAFNAGLPCEVQHSALFCAGNMKATT